MANLDVNHQSVGIKQDGVPEGAWIRRNGLLGTNKPLMKTNFEGVETVWDSFCRPVELYPNKPCFGVRKLIPPVAPKAVLSPRSSQKGPDTNATAPPSEPVYGPYEWFSFKQVFDRVKEIASGLRFLGLKRGSTLGMWAKNCMPWMLLDLAAMSNSLVSVAIYDTFGPSIVEYVMNHAELSTVCCADTAQVIALLKVAPKCPQFKTIVLFNEISDEVKSAVAAQKQVQVTSLAALEEQGRKVVVPLDPPLANDLAVLMYTSGTTDMPKAVMLTHGNMVSCAAAVQTFTGMVKEDVYMSYLPLAHIFEREGMTAFLGVGASVGFYTGNVAKLVDDIGELKPTFFVGVPRVYERIMNGVKDRVSQEPGYKRWFFEKAFESKKSTGESGWGDMLVFSKTKERLGGRVRILVSGGAPLAPATQEFVRLAFCCPVIQGYGLTETCAAGTVAHFRDLAGGHVGPPSLCCEIKLVDVPDMGYSAAKGEGEVWIRGPAVSPGYYKNPELTATDFSDGWFHTGDVGRWNATGTLSIIDRKKNIFKLAIGEYVAAERLELVYGKSPLIAQIWVYGEGTKNFLIAVAVPNMRTLTEAAAARGITGTPEELCANLAVHKIVLDDLARLQKEVKLQSFEGIKGLFLRPKEFTVDEELLTPTFKLKRPYLRKFFVKQLEETYARVEVELAEKEAKDKEAKEKEAREKQHPHHHDSKSRSSVRGSVILSPAPPTVTVAEAPVDEKLKTDWVQWLTAAGIDGADVAHYATILARHEFRTDDAKKMSAFHLTKKPFLFKEAAVTKFAAHAGIKDKKDKKDKKEKEHHSKLSDTKKSPRDGKTPSRSASAELAASGGAAAAKAARPASPQAAPQP